MRALLIMVLLLSGCGSTTRVGFVSDPGGATVNGTVSIVRISVTGDNSGTSITVTAVTLIGVGTTSDLVFCGDQRNLFPMNQNVTANYVPGMTCATLVSVKSP